MTRSSVRNGPRRVRFGTTPVIDDEEQRKEEESEISSRQNGHPTFSDDSFFTSTRVQGERDFSSPCLVALTAGYTSSRPVHLGLLASEEWRSCERRGLPTLELLQIPFWALAIVARSLPSNAQDELEPLGQNIRTTAAWASSSRLLPA